MADPVQAATTVWEADDGPAAIHHALPEARPHPDGAPAGHRGESGPATGAGCGRCANCGGCTPADVLSDRLPGTAEPVAS